MKQPVMPAMRDRVMLAEIANGVTRSVLARREGVCTSALTMRANRLGHAHGLSTAGELIAAAVRDGWILYDGKAWQPNPQPDDDGTAREFPAPVPQIRRWAEANGHLVAATGPLSDAVVEAYETACIRAAANGALARRAAAAVAGV